MFEYTAVLVIVGWAFWFTGRQIWKEIKQGQCATCSCPTSRRSGPQFVQLLPPDTDKRFPV